MEKPVIGILSRIYSKSTDSSYTYMGLPSDYIESVISAGGVPFILPVTTNTGLIEKLIDNIDGLLIPGGVDLNPLLYDEEPIIKQGEISDEIDKLDMAAVKIADGKGKPILGICRGIQIINAAFGGTLYQDLSEAQGYYIKHQQQAKRNLATHTVNIKKDTVLYEIFGSKAATNSFHHQAVKDTASGFTASAISCDGIIEAIEKTKPNFILGVQWHPEGMAKDNSKMLELFKRFMEEVKKSA